MREKAPKSPETLAFLADGIRCFRCRGTNDDYGIMRNCADTFDPAAVMNQNALRECPVYEVCAKITGMIPRNNAMVYTVIRDCYKPLAPGQSEEERTFNRISYYDQFVDGTIYICGTEQCNSGRRTTLSRWLLLLLLAFLALNVSI